MKFRPEEELESYWASRDAKFERLAQRLRSEGFVIEHCGGVAPVQIWGKLPNGQRFYFRARYESAELSVGGPDPADTGERNEKVTRWQHYAAGHIEADEAEEVLKELLIKIKMS
jgi:hypothetical protein